jgi:predicted MFS family arabinose efflux permease
MAFTSILFARIVPRSRGQLLALVGVTVGVLASFASLFVHGYWALVATRVVAGVGLGATIMISNVIVANFPDPAKVYAQIGCTNLLLGSALVAAYPLTVSLSSAATPYTTLAFALLILIPLMAVLPRLARFDRAADAEASPSVHADGTGRALGLNTFLLTAATFIVITSSGIVWGFYGLIGQQSGLSAAGVDSAIAVSIFTAFIGTSLPAVVGSSFGRIGPFCIALVLMTAAIGALTSHPTPMEFRVAVCVNVAAIYFILPYMSATAVALDISGRSATYVSSAFFFGSAASPFLGGILVTAAGFEFIGKLTLGLSVVVAAVFVYVDRQTTRHRVQIAAVE